ncbi:MATE family efflux transporter [Halorarum halophilum]|uniref:Multidrug-efflux transporter n=1 Tax=Halorarum halophilum TaxID=2743090 RepID=A0A7D5GGX8_9EURY|nr:MATE family efflux transporter [Halobaculum halophilum]QLG29488.1 MATE family efflux transporter [Halobaculum halophilum]
MFALAWPIVATQLLQVAYNLADTLWLGRYSTDAVAALSLAFPLIFLFISVGGGFNVAGATLVAQYTGAGQRADDDVDGDDGTEPAGDDGEEVDDADTDADDPPALGGEYRRAAGTVAGQTLSFITAIAVAVGLLGFLLVDRLLGVLPAGAATATQVIPLASGYMGVFFLGMPFLFGFFVFSALMRGYGNTRAPMLVMALSVAVNVVLDPILIFGFEGNPVFGVVGGRGLEASLLAATGFDGAGVQGAAVATVVSRGLATVVGLYVLLGTDAGPTVALPDFRPRLEYIRKIVTIGVPSALEQSASALGLIALTAMVATFAPEVVAAYGLGNRLVSLVFLPALGLGRATNTIVGQNLGAEKPERAEQAVWLAAKAGTAVMLCVAVVAFLFAAPIVGAFIATGTDAAAATIAYGADYIRVRAVEFAFIGVLQVVLGAYRGAGNTKTALAFSLVALWLGRVPIVYVLSFHLRFAEQGIWIGMAVGQIIGAIAAAAWFTRGTWKRTLVDDEGAPAGS